MTPMLHPARLQPLIQNEITRVQKFIGSCRSDCASLKNHATLLVALTEMRRATHELIEQKVTEPPLPTLVHVANLFVGGEHLLKSRGVRTTVYAWRELALKHPGEPVRFVGLRAGR